MITILINTDGIENAENKLGISTNLLMMLWSCQLVSQELGGRYMVKLTDIQMLLTRRFGSIATNYLLYAIIPNCYEQNINKLHFEVPM